jgi:small subunit ribosomal protein S16
MLMIRLQRIGRKNDPAFRIVVLPKTSGPKAGTYVDLVGTYNPKTKAFNANGARIKEWISKGAKLSPSLHNLLIDKGVIEGKKVNVLPKKSPQKKEGEPTPVATVSVASDQSETVAGVETAEVPIVGESAETPAEVAVS